MTRKQINTLKTKVPQTGEKVKQSQRNYEMQKEKMAKDKEERARRLEKRMKRKERVIQRQLRGVGKRRRGDSEESYDDEYDSEEPSSKRLKRGDDGEVLDEESSEQIDYDILLKGELMLIYQRSAENPQQTLSLNMVLKGSWQLSVEDNVQDFIYKKIGPPQQESALQDLYCANPSERIKIPPNADELFNPLNLDAIYNELYNC